MSRIDTAVDKQLEAQAAAAKTDKDRARARRPCSARPRSPTRSSPTPNYEKRLRPASAGSALAEKGAQTQRVLWARTGTKNKAYSDVLYVEELIGQDTVNTAPPATIDAFRDHGQAARDA